MLDHTQIHNSAVLTPQFIKCPEYAKKRRHLYVKVRGKGIKQCIECGYTKTLKEYKAWNTQAGR